MQTFVSPFENRGSQKLFIQNVNQMRKGYIKYICSEPKKTLNFLNWSLLELSFKKKKREKNPDIWDKEYFSS